MGLALLILFPAGVRGQGGNNQGIALGAAPAGKHRIAIDQSVNRETLLPKTDKASLSGRAHGIPKLNRLRLSSALRLAAASNEAYRFAPAGARGPRPSRTLIARVDNPNERPAELFDIGGYG